MKRAIIIMAEIPFCSEGETHLHAVLSDAECAEFTETLLADAIHKAKNFEARIIVAFSPPFQEEFFDRLKEEDLLLAAQYASDFGTRVYHAFEFAFAQNSDAVVLLNPNSPTFPLDYIEQAFEHLELNTDVVLGKTERGGIYLIGLRKSDVRIFDAIAWNSPQTFEKIFQNIHQLEWHLREVPSWYDIDDEKDFRQLREEFLHNANARRRAPKTFEWLKRNYMLS